MKVDLKDMGNGEFRATEENGDYFTLIHLDHVDRWGDTPSPAAGTNIKVDVGKDDDGNLLMIVEQELTHDQKDTLYQAMRLFKGGDFSGPGFNVYLQGEDIVLERKAKINPAWDATGGKQ